MMAESSSVSKRVKAAQNDDRISSLPNVLLLHILSFLPTKNSVITSLLSTRWRHLWKDLQVFDFCDDDEVIDISGGFVASVNGVLMLRRSRDIRGFRLTCAYNSDSSGGISVVTWVRAAIGPHLEELHLRLYCPEVRHPPVVLPNDLFACTKLKSLDLRGRFRVKVPLTVQLLSLKTLHLEFVSVDFVDSLLSGCPVLETLYLRFVLEGMNDFKVSVPSTVKKLRIEHNRTLHGTIIEIYAPSLEYLSINSWGRSSFSLRVEKFHNMKEVNLNILMKNESLNVLLKLLRAICRTRTLTLGRLTTKCLLHAYSLQLPQFHCLVNLELILPCFNKSFLLTMLQQCNMLQVLNIGILNYKERAGLQIWLQDSQPTVVPDCLVSHLNFCKFEGYEGNEDELAFVGYILRNGLVLETMIIDAYIESEKKLDILRELCGLPRGSNICQLRFI